MIQQNVPITPRATLSSGREPSTEDAVKPHFAPPLIPGVVTLPLKQFQAYQEACREQGAEVPETVSEALKTASWLL